MNKIDQISIDLTSFDKRRICKLFNLSWVQQLRESKVRNWFFYQNVKCQKQKLILEPLRAPSSDGHRFKLFKKLLLIIFQKKNFYVHLKKAM